MSICQHCEAREERPCSWTSRTREYYRVLMPALRHVAYRCGYALAVHGSLKTDIDLIACPWRETAPDAHYLVEQIHKAAEIIIGTARIEPAHPEKKSCGRLAWSIYLTPYPEMPGPYIDLSVMPVTRTEDTA